MDKGKPLFDRYLIVDWSANASPKLGADSIWMCELAMGRPAFKTLNIATRMEAMSAVFGVIERALSLKERLLVGFDFGFGYPRGFARLLTGYADWQKIWQRIARDVTDDEANLNNRFEAGSSFNATVAKAGHKPPFWGHPHQHNGRYTSLGAKRPDYDTLPEKRHVETTVRSAQPVWKLAYTGSVGGQTLLGIYWLERLRMRFKQAVQIWPFETRFAETIKAPVVVAEIYPSLFPVHARPDEVKDAAQVRCVAEGMAALDAKGDLLNLLSEPEGMTSASRNDVLREEGWIVGAGHSFDRGVFA